MKNIKKIVLMLVILVIIAGIVMICLKGFSYDLLYSKTQRLFIYMENEFEISEVEEIVQEVLGDNEFKVQLANSFGNVVSIVTYEITDEQQNSIIEKLNEKYEIEIDTESDTVVSDMAQIEMWDMVKKYIVPLLVVALISIIYLAVRFRHQGLVKSLLYPVLSVILVNALYISVIALCRIPINQFFVMAGIFVFALTLICNAIILGKKDARS